MISGAAVSKPTMPSIPASLGSAIVKPFDTMPITMSLASMPMAERYCCSAANGCTPQTPLAYRAAYVSEPVYTAARQTRPPQRRSPAPKPWAARSQWHRTAGRPSSSWPARECRSACSPAQNVVPFHSSSPVLHFVLPALRCALPRSDPDGGCALRLSRCAQRSSPASLRGSVLL